MRRFAGALERGDFDQAYELLSADYRGRVSLEEFKQRLEETPEETMTVSHALSHVSGPAQQEARLRYSDDGELVLHREQGRWALSENPVAFYDQTTPRAALRSFVRAMERRRYDVVMRLVPKTDKEGISIERMEEAWSGEGREEVERMLENLRSHMDAPIEVVGSHATMPCGERMRVEFILEDQVWKIEDPE